jgi:hypothetical protein
MSALQAERIIEQERTCWDASRTTNIWPNLELDDGELLGGIPILSRARLEDTVAGSFSADLIRARVE